MDIYIKEKCYICETKLDFTGVFICKTHTEKLHKILSGEIAITNALIYNPEFRHHCNICGEYENRVIINYPNWFYMCNICLESSVNRYMIR